MIRRWLFTMLLVLAGIGAPAHAQSPGWNLYPTASLTTDYRYNGGSFSDGEPAAQFSLYLAAPSRFYAGVWGSQVDFDDPDNTSYEVDLYAGKTVRAGATEFGVELLYTFFPDKTFRGPTYDFLQGKIRAKHALPRGAVGAHAAWTTEASYATGTALRTALDATYELSAWARTSANIGRRWIEIGRDRTYWDAGITLLWRKLSLDVRYVDTNLNAEACGARRCDATIVATVNLNLW